jgi:RNA polymerase sigma-70 factor (ECF subfamily)
MRDLTLTELERLQSRADEADVAFEMDEDTFRAFYDRTARSLWAYLSRMTGDRQAADDLLQESYYRLLRARVAFDGESHRRNYLFRIATNLVRDARRRQVAAPDRQEGIDIDGELPGDATLAARAESRADVRAAMARLKPRERELLWLAYAQGSSHQEIGEALGLKTGSIKPLLFRARRRLADMLRMSGYPGGRDAAS